MSFQISLPYKRSSERGFQHVNKIIDSVIQNFKCLLLTIPGEKVNDAEFGVGLVKFLFEYPTDALKDEIKSLITEKTAKYLPFITIKDITYDVYEEKLMVYIQFFIGNENNLNQITLSFDIDPATTR